MDTKKWECEALNNNDGIFVMHTGPSQAAQPIYHDFVMITYIAHGEGIHHCGGKDTVLKEGDVLIINPDVIHYFSSSSRFQYLELYYCFITPQKAKKAYSELKHDFPELQGFFDNTSLKSLHIKDNEKRDIRNLFIRMIDEFMNCPPGHKCMLN
ncbi:MAG: AraC family ligand binding domain-containing protein, partial [bacterium]|nr:AraC family ligand binding domain-containing protein [bacterium]